jgi:peptide/nickel transport system substrate-binding protein
MLKVFYASATYYPIVYTPDLQAYRTDRFEGWTRQPADTGPVIFSNTSPTYSVLEPLASTSDGGSNTAAIIAAIVAAVLAALGIGYLLTRRRSADERE